VKEPTPKEDMKVLLSNANDLERARLRRVLAAAWRLGEKYGQQQVSDGDGSRTHNCAIDLDQLNGGAW